MSTVQVGRNDLFAWDDVYEAFTIREEYSHPDYNNGTKQFDQKLLKLSGTSYAQVLSLQQSFSLSVEQTNLTVVGFGQPDRDGEIYYRLQQAREQYVPPEECSEMSTQKFGINTFHFKDTLFSDMFCANGNEAGVCSGDSGVPLIALGYYPSQDIQIGLASW
jgi:secreted trypsin-like serine protease